MGLAVATVLSALPDWEIHILDINSERGSQAASALARTTFHYADVTKYNTLSEAFQKAFDTHKRIDFVFANAGMIERFNFYDPCPAQTETITPPPEPDLLSIDADLKGVILTTYLAQHYFRASPDQGRGASIVLTASCGGLYPSYYSPLYSSAKCGFKFGFYFAWCILRILCPISPGPMLSV
jgi:NAD(P)-dependent dehydrogenase (short-subunit alcohol dehydrogenase family)